VIVTVLLSDYFAERFFELFTLIDRSISAKTTELGWYTEMIFSPPTTPNVGAPRVVAVHRATAE